MKVGFKSIYDAMKGKFLGEARNNLNEDKNNSVISREDILNDKCDPFKNYQPNTKGRWEPIDEHSFVWNPNPDTPENESKELSKEHASIVEDTDFFKEG